MEQQLFMKWFLEVASQEYNGRINILNANIKLCGEIEK
jgi:hypothetical protein